MGAGSKRSFPQQHTGPDLTEIEIHLAVPFAAVGV